MSSPFASECVSDPIPFPVDPDQSFVVRKLRGGEVEAAEREALRNFVSGRSSRGFAGHVARIFAGAGTEADAAKAASDPLAGYDRLALIRAGLVSWTYDKPLAAIDDLDDEAQELIATAVMKQTKPWLFQTAEEAERARKNAPSSFTVT